MASGEKAAPLTDKDKAAIESLKDAKVEVVYVLNGDKLGEIKLNVALPGTTLAALNSSGSESDTPPPTAVNITFDLKYSGLGEAQNIAAPAGAPVAKFADLMALFQSATTSG